MHGIAVRACWGYTTHGCPTAVVILAQRHRVSPYFAGSYAVAEDAQRPRPQPREAVEQFTVVMGQWIGGVAW